MGVVTMIITGLNALMNVLGTVLLAPLMRYFPGWLSNTLISAVTGVVLLIIFKYTSNQRAIGRVRDGIKANMLAVKLFKDSLAVTLKAQAEIFKGAFGLLFHAVRPMLVMIIPVSLLLAQLGLWYQHRPLRVGEKTLVMLKVNDSLNPSWPNVTINPSPAVQITAGPTKIETQRTIYWEIEACEAGYHELIFQVDNQPIEKELAVGSGFMKTSTQRPASNWHDLLLHPAENPIPARSVVQSIDIFYPSRPGYIAGSDWWMVYFFLASLVFALIGKPFLKVK